MALPAALCVLQDAHLYDVERAMEGDDLSSLDWQDEVDSMEQQRELNDNLALIRILDDPPPFGEFGPFATGAALGNSRQRRQTLLNFLAFCLARDNVVALATTIQWREHQSNQIVIHVARNTGLTTSHERERAVNFLHDIKRAWRLEPEACIQLVWAHVIKMTEVKLRKRLKKLRDAMHDLQGADGFVDAVDAWGKEETSVNALRWMKTWSCPSRTAALKDVFRQLSSLAEAEDFDGPYMYSIRGRFRLHNSYFLPISVLADSSFLREVEFGKTDHTLDVIHRIRRLRRRCLKLWCYEVGVHLLCTHARDSVRRILGAAAFAKFISENDDALCINWLETPHAVSDAMPRVYESAQDALLGVLESISDDSDFEEPFACNIADRTAAKVEWTPWCISSYHPELQLIDYLRFYSMRPSPAYVGCSKLACRVCKYYVEELGGMKWALNTGGLDVLDLEVPEDWLIPPSQAGEACAVILREEAARLVLREDNIQRVAWEVRHGQRTLGVDDTLKTMPLSISPLDISQ